MDIFFEYSTLLLTGGSVSDHLLLIELRNPCKSPGRLFGFRETLFGWFGTDWVFLKDGLQLFDKSLADELFIQIKIKIKKIKFKRT